MKRVRAAYPALNDGFAYLDGAAGTQVPATVIDAITDAYRAGLGNVGGAFPASDRSGAIVAECRQALADLTGISDTAIRKAIKQTQPLLATAGRAAEPTGIKLDTATAAREYAINTSRHAAK